MPNTKSAIRRTKKTKAQALINKIRKSKYKASIKQMTAFLEAGNFEKAKSFLPKFNSQLMKVAKTGVINKKSASRKISRITKKINQSKKK
jgi:small subunit ribosomal protein S20